MYRLARSNYHTLSLYELACPCYTGHILGWNFGALDVSARRRASFCWEISMAANHRSLANDELHLVEEDTSNIVSRQPAVVTRQPGDFRAGFVATLPLWLGAAP